MNVCELSGLDDQGVPVSGDRLDEGLACERFVDGKKSALLPPEQPPEPSLPPGDHERHPVVHDLSKIEAKIQKAEGELEDVRGKRVPLFKKRAEGNISEELGNQIQSLNQKTFALRKEINEAA